MARNSSKRIVALLLSSVLLLCCLFSPMALAEDTASGTETTGSEGSASSGSSSAEVRIGVINSSGGLNVRAEPGTTKQSLRVVPNGTMVYVVGEGNDSEGGLWYKVTEYTDKPAWEGYVYSVYLKVSVLDSGDTDFEAALTAQNFPESYKPLLRALHSLYPKWVFTAFQTGLDWSASLAAESVIGRNLVPRTSNILYINTSDVDENGNQIGRDGSAWVAASPEIIAYYMDPRNFLTDPYIFQFMSQTYNEKLHTEEGVNRILSGTFMDASNTITADGVTYTYAQAFMAAAKSSGVSPYLMASRVKQEQGSSGTALSSGTIPGYEGYYNFFNINAYTTSTMTAMQNGAAYAKTQNWNNQYVAIVEGSAFLGSSYINKGQDTSYFQKFNVSNAASGYYYHQYMTNTFGAATEASIMKAAYSDVDLALEFKIPVYNNMPETAVAKPTEATIAVVETAKYTVINGYIYKVEPGTTVTDIIASFTTSTGTLSVVNSEGNAQPGTHIVGTGDKLRVTYSGGKYKNYFVVIYGDVAGDGKFSIMDLMYIQRHLLGISTQTGSGLKACDVNHDGTINILDLMLMQKQLLGLYTITQGE